MISAIYNLSCDIVGCESHEQTFSNDTSKPAGIPDGWAVVDIYDAQGKPPRTGHVCPSHASTVLDFARTFVRLNDDDD